MTMEYTITCGQCGVKFTAARPHAKWCSRRCLLRFRRGTPSVSYCAECGADITARFGLAQFCVDCAATKSRESRERYLNSKGPLYSHCKGCGIEFDSPKRLVYCSQGCRTRFNNLERRSHEYHRTCPACLDEYTSHEKYRDMFCSLNCQRWAKKHPGKTRFRECLTCRTPFLVSKTQYKYCTQICMEQFHSLKRRGLLRANGAVECIDREQIAHRDKWRCQLCHRRVDQRVKWPHPMSPSLDHVVPVAQGGEHTKANIQLAHLVCNMRKWRVIRQPQQLALIG